jgi:uncharacterized membrane protein YgcG
MRGLLGLAVFFCNTWAWAQVSSPLPEFDGRRVHVVDTDDVFSSLENQIAQVEKQSRQTYFVVVVKWIGGEGQIVPATDRLYSAWRDQASRKGLAFDPERSVLIVLAVDNRELAVHPGRTLAAGYGLAGERIDREIVQPHFVPRAREGDPAGGLLAMIQAVERWVSSADQAAEQQRQEELARARQLAKDAQTTIEEAQALAAALETEFVERETLGFGVADFRSQAQLAATELTAAQGALPGDPQQALERARRAASLLQGAQSEVRGQVAVATDADQELDLAWSLAGDVELSLQEASQSDLATGPLRSRLDAVRGELERARQNLKADPRKSLAAAQEAVRDLRGMQQATADLERQSEEAADRLQAIRAEVERASLAVDRAREDGADVAREFQALEEARRVLVEAENLAGTDYARSLQSLDQVEKSVVGMPERAGAARDRHRFLTRTLPAGSVSLAGLGTVAALGGLRYRRGRRHKQVAADWSQLKDRAVAWMERLEQLKKRHQSLPIVDPDFTEPMAGKTLACYERAQESVSQLWAAWVARMDLVREIEALLHKESFLGVSRLDQARELLTKQGADPDLTAGYDECTRTLDELETSHERAREAQAALAEDARRLDDGLKALEEVGIPAESFQSAREEAALRAGQAASVLVSDPLGALERLMDARSNHAAAIQSASEARSAWDAAEESSQRLHAISARTRDLRAGGTRMEEEGGNPDRPIAAGLAEIDQARSRLREVNTAEARAAVERSMAAADQAEQAIHRTLAARKVCEENLAGRETAHHRLQGHLDAAAGAQRQLEESFARDSWADVQGSLQSARPLFERIRQALGAIRDACRPETQKYLAAEEMLKTVLTDEAQVDSLAGGIMSRRATLEKTRTDSLAAIDGVRQAAAEARAYLDANRRSIRPASEQSLAAVETGWRTLEGAIAEARPHWPHVSQGLSGLSQRLSEARKQLSDDVAAEQELQAAVQSARRRVGEVRDWLSKETADRPRANERFATACQAMAGCESQAAVPQSDWKLLKGQLAAAMAEVDRAVEMARDDAKLAQQAYTQIAAAERAVQTARGFCQSGVTADCSAAAALAERARSELARQDYERALQSADQAERMARDASNQAAARARELESRLALERQRREQQNWSNLGTLVAVASSLAQAGQGVRGASNMGAGGTGPRPAPPAPSPSPTSQTGWSSNTSRSKW